MPLGSNSYSFHEWTLVSSMNLFFTGRVPTIWEWHVMVLLRPWHTRPTGLGPGGEVQRAPPGPLKTSSSSVPYMCYFFVLGFHPQPLLLNGNFLFFSWKPSSNGISLNPCEGWHSAFHFLFLQTPQVEAWEGKTRVLFNFFIFTEVNRILGL